MNLRQFPSTSVNLGVISLLQVCKIIESQLEKLRTGSFPLPDSAYIIGVADPTGSLSPGTVCLVDASKHYTERDAILYRHPGLHPGDVRRVRMVAPPPELLRHVDGHHPERAAVLIMPTSGVRSFIMRSLPDHEMIPHHEMIPYHEVIPDHEMIPSHEIPR